jgi:hypothetical protein
LRAATEKAADASHAELLAGGTVFVDMEDLDIPCVGVSVPISEAGQRAHLSFTKDWFHSHTDDEVVEALLEDLVRALSEAQAD